MSKVKGKCSACGAPLELDIAKPFAEGEMAGALCPEFRRSMLCAICLTIS
jgi:hypothetical protein